VLSSEEEELKRIAAEKEAVAKSIKAAQQSYHHLQSQAHSELTVLPVRSVVSLTHPEEFNLHTARRAKTALTNVTGLNNIDLNTQKDKEGAALKKKEWVAGELTKPQPFALQTSRRHREHKVMSSEELEVQALQAIQPFKARELNREILTSGGQLGVPRTNKAPLTQATSPQLATKERVAKRKPEEVSAAAGEPAGFQLFGSETHRQSICPTSAKKVRREAQPFQLATDLRGKQKEEEFKAKLAEEEARAAAARAFHAKPMLIPPSPIAASLATPRAHAPVVPVHEPKCIAESKQARAKWEQKVKEEEEAAREAARFRAKPNPFSGLSAAEMTPQPIKSARPPTIAQEPALESERRAQRWREREAEMTAREAELKALSEQHAKDAEAAKAREMAAYRKSLVPKAQPLKQNIMERPTFVPKPSNAPLTQPESPMLITKRRGSALQRRGAVEEEPAQQEVVRMQSLEEEEEETPADENTVQA
jgi:hypothetical protein